jgi:hypothetical protein
MNGNTLSTSFSLDGMLNNLHIIDRLNGFNCPKPYNLILIILETDIPWTFFGSGYMLSNKKLMDLCEFL